MILVQCFSIFHMHINRLVGLAWAQDSTILTSSRVMPMFHIPRPSPPHHYDWQDSSACPGIHNQHYLRASIGNFHSDVLPGEFPHYVHHSLLFFYSFVSFIISSLQCKLHEDKKHTHISVIPNTQNKQQQTGSQSTEQVASDLRIEELKPEATTQKTEEKSNMVCRIPQRLRNWQSE